MNVFTPPILAPVRVADPVAQALVGWWHFGDGNDASVRDVSHQQGGVFDISSGNGVEATPYGRGVQFDDGSITHVDLNRSFSALGCSDGLTICVWFRPGTNSSYNGLVVASTAIYMYCAGSSNKAYFKLTTDAGSRQIDNQALGWVADSDYFWAMRWASGEKVAVYIDGELHEEYLTALGGAITNTSDIFIGSRSATANPYEGLIYDAAIFKRGLGSEEIRDLHRDRYRLFRQPAWGDLTLFDGGGAPPAGTAGPLVNSIPLKSLVGGALTGG